MLFKDNKKRSTGSRISLSPNTSRLSQISYHVAPKPQMTQPKAAEDSLKEILKKYRLNLKSGKREWDAKSKELVEFYDKNVANKELKENKKQKSPSTKSDKSNKDKLGETQSSKDKKSTNATSNQNKKAKK